MLSNTYESDNRNASIPSVSSPETNEFGLIFGGYRPSNRQEILAAIPSKPIVDKMVAGYFLDRPIVPGMCTQV